MGPSGPVPGLRRRYARPIAIPGPPRARVHDDGGTSPLAGRTDPTRRTTPTRPTEPATPPTHPARAGPHLPRPALVPPSCRRPAPAAPSPPAPLWRVTRAQPE